MARPAGNRRERCRLSFDPLESRLLLSKGGKPPGGDPPPPPAPADPAIAFVASVESPKKSTHDLMVMNADGSNRTAIWRAPAGHSLSWSSWSPDLDGDSSNGYLGTIAVARRAEDFSTYAIELVDVGVVNGVPVAQDVYRIVDGTDPNIPNGSTLVTGPEWSPDLDPDSPGYQGKFTFQAGGGINTIDVWWDTDPATVGRVGFDRESPSVAVPLPEPADEYYDTGVSYPSWSPDLDGDPSNGYQGRLAYSRYYGLAPQTPRIRRMDAIEVTVDSQGVRYGTETIVIIPPNDDGTIPIELEWSRDGSRIAYSAGGLATVEPANGNAVETIDTAGPGARSPSWSPDDPSTTDVDESDRYLVFHNISGSNVGIRRVDLSTGTVVTLASPKGGNYVFPDWRPFPSHPALNADIALDSESGTGSRMVRPATSPLSLTPTSGLPVLMILAPESVPDGRHILRLSAAHPSRFSFRVT